VALLRDAGPDRHRLELAAHNDEILAELGYTAQIDNLRERRII
jgi:hypothetical protein